jgi:Mg2+ and Co2+ transporter CorA
MRAIQIDIKGNQKELDLSRKKLTKDFEMHMRDLRPIFSLRQMPTISRRGKGIVINFRSIKIIIAADRVFIFNLTSKKIVSVFIPDLAEKIKSREKNIQIEHIVLETAMAFILGKTKSNFVKVSQITERILTEFSDEGKVSNEIFEELLSVKKKLSKLSKNVHEITEILDGILEDEEEMKELYFAGKVEDIDEIESILENNLEQLEDIENRIDELDENIDDTQEILTLKLSSRRNRIIQFDLILTSATGILALLAVVTGFFGMNIRSNIEESHLAFWVVAALMILCSIFLGMWLWRWMKRSKIL